MPPDQLPTRPRRNHVSEKLEAISHAQVQAAIKLAREQMPALGLHFGGNKLNRLVRT